MNKSVVGKLYVFKFKKVQFLCKSVTRSSSEMLLLKVALLAYVVELVPFSSVLAFDFDNHN